MEEKIKEEAKRRKEISERAQKEREKVDGEEGMSSQEVRRTWMKKEKKARMDVEVADELLNEASSKLDDALVKHTFSTKTSVTVAKMMLDTAKEKCQKAMDSLDNIRKAKEIT